MKNLTLIPGQLSLAQLREVFQHPLTITLDEQAFAAINESVACVNAILAEGRTAALYVDRRNPVSSHLYASLGFRRVFSQSEYRPVPQP